jgi:hypothetical protein
MERPKAGRSRLSNLSLTVGKEAAGHDQGDKVLVSIAKSPLPFTAEQTLTQFILASAVLGTPPTRGTLCAELFMIAAVPTPRWQSKGGLSWIYSIIYVPPGVAPCGDAEVSSTWSIRGGPLIIL